eukprot:731339-Prymnesium_polylepis.1
MQPVLKTAQALPVPPICVDDILHATMRDFAPVIGASPALQELQVGARRDTHTPQPHLSPASIVCVRVAHML